MLFWSLLCMSLLKPGVMKLYSAKLINLLKQGSSHEEHDM